MKQQHIEITAALVFCFLCLLAIWHASSFADAGSSYFPIAILAIAATLCITWAIQSLVAARRTTDRVRMDKAATKRVVTVGLLVVAYFIGIPFIGFLSATILFMLIAARASGYKNWLVAVITVGSITLILYLVFFQVLRTPMPPELIFGFAGA